MVHRASTEVGRVLPSSSPRLLLFSTPTPISYGPHGVRRRTQSSATPLRRFRLRAHARRALTSGAWPRGCGTGGEPCKRGLPGLISTWQRPGTAVPGGLGRAARGARSATSRPGSHSPPRGGQRVLEPGPRQVRARASVLPVRPPRHPTGERVRSFHAPTPETSAL